MLVVMIAFIVFGFISVYFFEKGVPPTAIGNQFFNFCIWMLQQKPNQFGSGIA